MSDKPLTAAELLRRKAGVNGKGSGEVKPCSSSPDSIDDEIKRLEEELQKSQSDESGSNDADDSSSSSDGSEYDDPKHEAALPTETCFSLSKFRDDRIEPLPVTCLPTLTSKQRLHDKSDPRPSKKQKKHAETDSAQTIDPEIQQSVQAMLQQYVPRSRDKLPFYCRFCQHQYSNETEFKVHQTESDFHKAAVQAERKATYCKLCQKQMTSPTQMQEHLNSGPHKERLLYRKQMQQQPGNSRGDNGANHDGRGPSFQTGGRNVSGGRGQYSHGGGDGARYRYQSNGRRDARQWK